MNSKKASILVAENLGYTIDGRFVLQDFSLEMDQGAHRLILGPSGSGKTTLINLITGLATPSSGKVMISGEPMSTLSGAARDSLRRRMIGVVFQSLRLVSALTVRGNLRLAQRLAGIAHDETNIDRLIREVGIAHRADAKPRDLSLGEAQRAAIARALIGKPQLIVADEPTSALDDANADKIARLLLSSADQCGATLLIATHDARLKSYISESVVLPPVKAEVAR